MDRNASETASPACLQALADEIAELSGHLNAADRRWLALIAEFDRREGWSSAGARSCAHWLNWKCGLDLGAAREKLRVAHALDALPAIGAAMGRGELSYSKVRALTRIATPETEDYLLSIALHGTAEHVERLVRAYRRFRETEALSAEARQQAGRALHCFTDEDGALVIRGRLPAETGVLFMKAVEAVIRQQDEEATAAKKLEMLRAATDVAAETSCTSRSALSGVNGLEPPGSVSPDTARVHGMQEQTPADVPAETLSTARGIDRSRVPDAMPADVPAETSSTARIPLSQRRADALGVLAESFLAHGFAALSGGERQQIVVHVDAATLAAHSPEEPATARCEFEDGPAMAAETARRLACDASIVTIVEDARGHPLDVSRRTRSIPPALRRALQSRDHGCRFPGCTHQRYVDGHHVQHWAHGGATKLGNLISLCRFHHRLVHEGGVRIEALTDARWRFHLRDGTVLETAARLSRLCAAATSPREDDSAGHHNRSHDPVHLNHLERCSAIIAANTAQSIRITPQTAVTRWRGESMDYGLAIEALCGRAQRAADRAPESPVRLQPPDRVQTMPPRRV